MLLIIETDKFRLTEAVNCDEYITSMLELAREFRMHSNYNLVNCSLNTILITHIVL